MLTLGIRPCSSPGASRDVGSSDPLSSGFLMGLAFPIFSLQTLPEAQTPKPLDCQCNHVIFGQSIANRKKNTTVRRRKGHQKRASNSATTS